MRKTGEKVAATNFGRANEVGFLVCQRRDTAMLAKWWARCIQLAWPCVTVLTKGRMAEVKADAHTARRQVFSQGACYAMREVIDEWSPRLGQSASSATGPVVFALDRVPVDQAENLAHELLAAARIGDPTAFSHPRTDTEYKRRMSFLTTMARERDFAKVMDQAAAYKKPPVHHEEPETPPTLTKVEWKEILLNYGGACAYCERHGMLLIQDQLVPATSGGKHVRGNVVPACVECNGRKAGRMASEFIAASNDLFARKLRGALGIPVPPPKTRRKQRRR